MSFVPCERAAVGTVGIQKESEVVRGAQPLQRGSGWVVLVNYKSRLKPSQWLLEP